MPQPVMGQPMLSPDGKPVLDLQGHPVIYHGQLVNTTRDPQGRTVWVYEDGSKVYAQPTDDQGNILKAPDSGGIFREEPTWNSQTGQYDKGALDWGSILGLGIGGLEGGLGAAALAGDSGAGAGLGTDLVTSGQAAISSAPAAVGSTAGGSLSGYLGATMPEVMGAGAAGGAAGGALGADLVGSGEASISSSPFAVGGTAANSAGATGAAASGASASGVSGVPSWMSGGNGEFDPSHVYGGPGDNSGSFMSNLLGNKEGLSDLASGLGAFSSGQKANRVVQGNFAQGYDRNMLAAQTARNANESDALKKLAQTEYIQSGGSKFRPPTLNLGGGPMQLPDLGYGPQPISANQKAGAATLESQLLDRLKPGGSYTPQPLSSYGTPGTAENVGNYGSLALGGLGFLSNLFNRG